MFSHFPRGGGLFWTRNHPAGEGAKGKEAMVPLLFEHMHRPFLLVASTCLYAILRGSGPFPSIPGSRNSTLVRWEGGDVIGKLRLEPMTQILPAVRGQKTGGLIPFGALPPPFTRSPLVSGEGGRSLVRDRGFSCSPGQTHRRRTSRYCVVETSPEKGRGIAGLEGLDEKRWPRDVRSCLRVVPRPVPYF